MTRVVLMVMLLVAVLAAPLATEAQQAGKVYRIGFLGVGSREGMPLVEQRQRIADSLVCTLTQLGLERRPRPPLDLSQYSSQRRASASAPHAEPTGGDPQHAQDDRDSEPDEATEAGKAARVLLDGLQALAPTLRARPRSTRPSTGPSRPSRRPWSRGSHSARPSPRWSA
jgi:hypothetical protein